MSMTFPELAARASTFHRGYSDALVEKGAQLPLFVMFGERHGFVPCQTPDGTPFPDEALAMTVRALGASALMTIGIAQRTTVLLALNGTPSFLIHHRREPDDERLEVWSVTVLHGESDAISLVTPVTRTGEGYSAGSCSSTVHDVDTSPDAARLRAILAAAH